MASPTIKSEVFHKSDAIKEGIKCGLIGAGSGLFLSATMNSLSRKNLGVMSVFTRTGYLIGFSGE